MTESDQDAVLGRAAREHSEAQERLTKLAGDAANIAHTLRRLSEAIYDGLRDKTENKVAYHLDILLQELERDKFDWSKLSRESLAGMAVALKKTAGDLARAAEQKRDLRI